MNFWSKGHKDADRVEKLKKAIKEAHNANLISDKKGRDFIRRASNCLKLFVDFRGSNNSDTITLYGINYVTLKNLNSMIITPLSEYIESPRVIQHWFAIYDHIKTLEARLNKLVSENERDHSYLR